MKRLTVLIALSLSLCVTAALAQQKRAMTFEDILALKGVSDARISPDGKWIAYVVTTVDMKENDSDSDLWLVSTAGGQPLRLTTSSKNDNQPRWSPDGRLLAFISSREAKPQIFLISPFGGEAERLTESKSGVQSFEWSPDSRRIAYVAGQEMTPAEEKKQKEKDDPQVVDKDFKFSRIWLIDVETKKASELVKGDYVARDPQWSPDGRRIAYTTTPTPKADDGSLSDIWIIDVESGKQRKLIENEGPDNSPRWSPDGRLIAFLSRDSEKGLLGQSRLRVIPSEGGAAREVAPALDIRKSSFKYQPGSANWSADGRTIYFNAQVGTANQLFALAAAGGEVKQLSKTAGQMSAATFSGDGAAIAFTRSDPQHPGDVYFAKIASPGDAIKLTDHNPQVRDLTLGTSEVIKWKSKDDLEIEGVVIYPVGYQRGKRYPMVALVHGGPSGVWTQGFPGSWGNFGHVYAGKGWTVFYPNVRGSSGYGEKFLLANVRDWGGGDYQDIQTGIDHLISKGVADPDKLAQAGWSYGGYMTAWTLTQTNRFKAVMVGAGLTNMFSMYSTNDLQRVLEGYFGAEPWDDLEVYTRASAMAFIKQAKTPTLILHGAVDLRVPVGQAQELYMGLHKNDVPVELVFYPREPHGLREPRHQLDKMRREYAWFSKYVLGVEVPEPEKDDKKKPDDKPSTDR
ncbi:MAG: S9 family peptidase [Blastocatellia bacterium]|nr:S9 family peptidase [Blastocatellia bacterium]